MRKGHMLKAALCLLTILLFNTGGGCDQTQLSGDVIVPDRVIMVNEPVGLQLVVPETLSGIYRVYWQLNPEEGGEIIYGEALTEQLSAADIQRYFDLDEIDPDRHVLFTGTTPGRVHIEVYGYYKQTNPQPITEFELDINES